MSDNNNNQNENNNLNNENPQQSIENQPQEIITNPENNLSNEENISIKPEFEIDENDKTQDSIDKTKMSIKSILSKKKSQPLKLTNKNLLARMAYAETISPLRGLTKAQKKKEQKMTEEEKEANRKILYNMNLKLNFVKNPRFRENIAPPLYSTNKFSPIDSKENPFSVDPKEIVFRDYQQGCVYQIDLKVLNRTQLLTNFKYIPPLTENFAIKKVIYPKKDSSLIAPGMFAKIQVIFHATSMANFNDEITILTEKMAFKVPLKAIRDKPAVSLINPMNCGKCFLGDRVETYFVCKNNGGDAHFKFVSNENKDNNDFSQNSNEILNVGPFNLFPQEFYLYKGMSQNISVTFSPQDEGIIEKKLTLYCESSMLEYSLKGEGIKVDIIIKSVDGLEIEEKIEENENNNRIDSAKNNNSSISKNSISVSKNEDENSDRKSIQNELDFKKNFTKKKSIYDKPEKIDILFFPDTYPYTSNQRKMIFKNVSSVPIKFHWTVYDFYHQNEFSMVNEENYFTIFPEEGTFQPSQEIEFTINFNPLNSKIYEQKLDLIIEDIPFPAIKQFDTNIPNIKNTFSKAEPYLPGFNSAFPSYPLYSFTLRGRGSLPYLECSRKIIDLGDVYLGTEINDFFSVFNPKVGVCQFKKKIMCEKLVNKKLNDDDVDFFNDQCINDENVFKSKKNLLRKQTEILNDVYSNFEYKTNLEFEDVNYLKIVTNEKNIINNYSAGESTILRNNTNSINNSKIHSENIEKKSTKNSQNLISNNINSTNNNNNNNKILNVEDIIKITKNQTIDFEIFFKPEKLGIYKSSIVFELTDGEPFNIDIKANIIGPKLTINTPFLDFGLFSINTIQTQQLEIENLSPISCTFLIKESRYKSINFKTFSNLNYIKDFEGEITENDKKKKNKIETILDYDNQNMNKYDIDKTDSYVMKFSQVFGELKPFEKRTINVYFHSPFPIHLNTFNSIEVLTLFSPTNNFINYQVQCEQAEAYIENVYIKPKQIFLTMPIECDNNTITIINPSNLPIHFKWDNIFEAEKFTAEFEPNQGKIEPHSSIKIKYKVIYFFLAHIDDLFVCHIDEMDIPLGVVIQGDVIGLDIDYLFTPESFEYLDKLNSQVIDSTKAHKTHREHNLAKTGLRNTKRAKTVLKVSESEINEDAKFRLSNISMRNLKVNTPAEIFFKIKNLSGIPTNFDLSVNEFPPGKEKVKKDRDTTMSSNTTLLSRISRKSKKNSKFVVDHPLLTTAHEAINFTSPKGLEFTKQKEIQKDSILYLSNKKGIAIVIEPKKGELVPHGEVLIKLSVFNECVGEYHDVLISKIKGLENVEFPIDLKIKGNPLELAPFQAGINYLLDPPLLKMGYLLRNVGEIQKNVRFENTGTNTIALDWKIYDYEDFLKPNNRNIVNIKIKEDKLNNKFLLNFNSQEPNEFPPEKQYFKIEPEHTIVEPKSVSDFTVTFKTDSEGMKNALFIAYPKIEGENKVQFNELALKVIGGGLKPHLIVDKNPNFNKQFEYRFTVHSYGRHPMPKRPIILINKEKINMIIKLNIEGPFQIINTEPIQANLGDGIFNIIPNSNLKVDIKYLIPNVNNEQEWPMTLINEKKGKLHVTFENGESEDYYLTAILKRPRIILSLTGNESVESLDYVDFGYVNCASKKIIKMFLMDETEVDTNWKITYEKFLHPKIYGHGTVTTEEKEDINMNDDPSVFNFDISDGVIYGPTEILTDLPVGPGLPKVETEENKKYKPLVIHVMFKPKKNVFYKCRYKIVTSTGNIISFTLKGYGSYKEEDIIEDS